MLNIRAALKSMGKEEVANQLAQEFERRGVTTIENLHNAPLKIKVTYGVDIYKLMDLLRKDSEGKLTKRTVKRGDSQSSIT